MHIYDRGGEICEGRLMIVVGDGREGRLPETGASGKPTMGVAGVAKIGSELSFSPGCCLNLPLRQNQSRDARVLKFLPSLKLLQPLPPGSNHRRLAGIVAIRLPGLGSNPRPALALSSDLFSRLYPSPGAFIGAGISLAV
ncbi:hypothetical protein DM860_016005 [Cuscuta australis]|uniref:Uncharacterized protein n=1 Tax=Cuscuta australis TaxID=267555 RepID=A0A328DNB0_9ASTE|nr:hypothetical protein DM860_016005 [Cuscuta australis]